MFRDNDSAMRDTRPSILTVEDDDVIRALIGGILSTEFNMYSAKDAAAGMAIALEHKPDLILLDVGLPDMDGFEACRRIKAHPALADIPIIFLTGRSSPTDEVEGLEAGGIDYIAKPINPIVLRARIRNHLELKKSRDALERMVRIDSLTGLANRHSIDDTLLREWRRQARTKQPLAVIMIGVDDFKQYNDTCGQGAGDVCLKSIALAIKDALQRPADLIARYDGETFVVLLPDNALEGAATVAEVIRTAVAALEIQRAGSKIAPYVTVSLGVACTTPETDKEPAEFLEAAAAQLTAARSEGGNRVKGINFAKT